MFFNKIVKKWSAVELQYLIDNHDKLSMEQLCKDLLKHEDQIHEQLNKLKLEGNPHRKGPEVSPRYIRVCQHEPCRAAFLVTDRDIQRGHGLYCSNQCHANSNKIHRPSKIELVSYYEDGLSSNDLSEKYQVSKGTIYNWFKFYGIEQRTLSDSLHELFKTDKGCKAIQKRLDTLEKKYGTRAPNSPVRSGKYKRGYRQDLKVSVRSGWEANCLRWLNKKNKKWQYEPKVFVFEGIKKGCMSYLPDIYLPEDDLWIEIKGHLRSQDKVKIRRFQKYFPNEFKRLRVICNANSKADEFYKELGIPILAYYNDLKVNKNEIPNWE